MTQKGLEAPGDGAITQVPGSLIAKPASWLIYTALSSWGGKAGGGRSGHVLESLCQDRLWDCQLSSGFRVNGNKIDEREPSSEHSVWESISSRLPNSVIQLHNVHT